jgi:hypothetical protein
LEGKYRKWHIFNAIRRNYPVRIAVWLKQRSKLFRLSLTSRKSLLIRSFRKRRADYNCSTETALRYRSEARQLGRRICSSHARQSRFRSNLKYDIGKLRTSLRETSRLLSSSSRRAAKVRGIPVSKEYRVAVCGIRIYSSFSLPLFLSQRQRGRSDSAHELDPW